MADNNVSDNKIVTYRGKRIEDMSREELIEALNFAANEIQRLMRDFLFETFIRCAR